MLLAASRCPSRRCGARSRRRSTRWSSSLAAPTARTVGRSPSWVRARSFGVARVHAVRTTTGVLVAVAAGQPARRAGSIWRRRCAGMTRVRWPARVGRRPSRAAVGVVLSVGLIRLARLSPTQPIGACPRPAQPVATSRVRGGRVGCGRRACPGRRRGSAGLVARRARRGLLAGGLDLGVRAARRSVPCSSAGRSGSSRRADGARDAVPPSSRRARLVAAELRTGGTVIGARDSRLRRWTARRAEFRRVNRRARSGAPLDDALAAWATERRDPGVTNAAGRSCCRGNRRTGSRRSTVSRRRCAIAPRSRPRPGRSRRRRAVGDRRRELAGRVRRCCAVLDPRQVRVLTDTTFGLLCPRRRAHPRSARQASGSAASCGPGAARCGPRRAHSTAGVRLGARSCSSWRSDSCGAVRRVRPRPRNSERGHGASGSRLAWSRARVLPLGPVRSGARGWISIRSGRRRDDQLARSCRRRSICSRRGGGRGATPFERSRSPRGGRRRPLARRSAAVLATCRLGASFETALANSARRDPRMAPLTSVLATGIRLGAAVNDSLARLAAESRRDLRRRAEAGPGRCRCGCSSPSSSSCSPFGLLTVVPAVAAGFRGL